MSYYVLKIIIITEQARQVALLEFPSCGQAWASGSCGRPSRKALAAEESYTLHRPVCYCFPRWQIIVSGLGEQLQRDLVECSEYWEANNGTRYLFCCIDMFYKYAWAQPQTIKHGAETAAAKQMPRDGEWAAAGCAEWQGHRNACSLLVIAEVQGHSLFHRWEWRHKSAKVECF